MFGGKVLSPNPIAKEIVYSKIQSQNLVLQKYGVEQHDLMMVKAKIQSLNSNSLKEVRKKLLPIEGRTTEHYFGEIFKLFPKSLRIEKRKSFKAYDGVNNTFNLAYTILKYKVHSAILKAHLEPFLGFVHAEAHSEPSLICDMMEIYRGLIDHFIIEFSQSLNPNTSFSKANGSQQTA
jgi:CRISPR-associated protein Cas1